MQNRAELLQISTAILTSELTAAHVSGRFSGEDWRGEEDSEQDMAKRAVNLASLLIQEVDSRGPFPQPPIAGLPPHVYPVIP